ncbi:MAG: hypothetical protein RMK75_05390 [Aquificaceae bacterium]|nr:hypothetical protein [Aquificaceae bacterium]MDW8067264.1 hypothetical protein [Aquificaceae bacterium]MDW8423740.1 hypothetical protein [Aquificaceae bacterium]
MENLLNLLIFLGKLLLLMVVLGVPLFLIVAFVADKVYKKVEPKYEELRERRIKDLEEKAGKNKKEKKT